ncbi:MAG: hypothetical protein COB35_13530 [Gammaproteobacteria bacterium]|nr:MAG: hypothetical protein COB35_13530 [Gammaproteobacteria bacterium]
MSKPEFKLLPCVFCTLGYNTYVAGYRMVSKTAELMTKRITDEAQPVTKEQQAELLVPMLTKQKN